MIFGRDRLPALACFNDVDSCLDFDCDVYLGSHAYGFLGDRVPVGSAIYNMEPLYDGCRSLSVGYMDILKTCHVIDYSAKNVQYLKHKGIEAFHMPYGWHKGLDRVVESIKDIEVLFIGSYNQRRYKIIEKLREKFDVVWVSGVYGAELDKLVARAKVHLNIHYVEDHPLEVVRLNYLLANGCNVVSEPGNDDEVNNKYSSMLHMTWDLEQGLKELVYKQNIKENMMVLKHDCSAANEWLQRRYICHG
jgi:hypothetical protein